MFLCSLSGITYQVEFGLTFASFNKESSTLKKRQQLHLLTSGGIQIKTSHTASYAAEGSESYHLGMAAYKNPTFSVDETFPDNGVILIAVPEIYD